MNPIMREACGVQPLQKMQQRNPVNNATAALNRLYKTMVRLGMDPNSPGTMGWIRAVDAARSAGNWTGLNNLITHLENHPDSEFRELAPAWRQVVQAVQGVPANTPINVEAIWNGIRP